MAKLYAHRVYAVTLNDNTSRIIDFFRLESGSFQYGNQNCVKIEINEREFEFIDTRYDNEVMKNFPRWCETWIKNHYKKESNPTWKRLL